MRISDEIVGRIRKELESIRRQAPPCPDPAEGGCIGHHCIWCASGEIIGMLNGAEKDDQAREKQLREVDSIFKKDKEIVSSHYHTLDVDADPEKLETAKDKK